MKERRRMKIMGRGIKLMKRADAWNRVLCVFKEFGTYSGFGWIQECVKTAEN